MSPITVLPVALMHYSDATYAAKKVEMFFILLLLDFQKLDEIQVKVVVADIDDNGPTFLAHNMTLGKFRYFHHNHV